MRQIEQEMNEFMNQKLLSIKEDLLQASQQAKVKRNLNMLLKVQPGEELWTFRLEGKLQNEMSEEEILNDKSKNFRFMSFFERIQIDFPGNEASY